MGRPLINLVGKKFGSLLVLRRVKNHYNGSKKWHSEAWFEVLCDCGKKVKMRGYMVRDGRVHECRECKPKGWEIIHGLSETKEYQIWCTVKRRAKEEGIKFTIEPSDIVIPKICPLLEIRISATNKKTSFNSPSVDRLNNDNGYIKENIWIISHKANAMKSSASLIELQTLVKNLRKKLCHTSI